MNKQEFKIYMEKCRVPQSLQPIIEQYQNCFGQNLREIGLIKTNPPSEFRLTIAKNWNGQPYHTTPYSQTPEEQEAIEKYVQEQLEAGKIEPVLDLTGWNHSCTVAKKKDNEITGAKNRLRVCVDYKPINAVTETVSFAIPAKEEILESIGQWNMYIAIDISSAYTHIPIPPQYRHYLAFSIKNGEKYQPVVMNFGGKCMPMVFAAAMRRVFRPLINNGWFYQYFDDLTIGGNNEEDLTKKFNKVLQLCKEANLKIKLTKCDWFKKEIKLLGWIISKNGRKIDPKHIKTINNWKWPEKTDTIVKELQAFNGLINYCARFIPNLAEKQHYIQRAIKNKNIADKEAQKAFEEIKTEIKKDRQLGRIDPKKKAIIYTDASHVQTGAAIVQQENGKPTVRSYYSYTFKESELKWSILRKEAFAIHKAMKKFREMLKWHTPGMVEIRCDNQTLVKQLQKTEQPIDEIIAGIYQDINLRGINVNYVNGKENTLADALSRNISSKGVLKERGEIEIALREIMELPIVVKLGKLSEKEMINSINLE